LTSSLRIANANSSNQQSHAKQGFSSVNSLLLHFNTTFDYDLRTLVLVVVEEAGGNFRVSNSISSLQYEGNDLQDTALAS
jgi:hypothetical protein